MIVVSCRGNIFTTKGVFFFQIFKIWIGMNFMPFQAWWEGRVAGDFSLGLACTKGPECAELHTDKNYYSWQRWCRYPHWRLKFWKKWRGFKFWMFFFQKFSSLQNVHLFFKLLHKIIFPSLTPSPEWLSDFIPDSDFLSTALLLSPTLAIMIRSIDPFSFQNETLFMCWIVKRKIYQWWKILKMNILFFIWAVL